MKTIVAGGYLAEMASSVADFCALEPLYRSSIDDGLVGFEPFSALAPWYFLPDEEIFNLADQWPRTIKSRNLIAFARRQDCDDIACFDIEHEGTPKVELIEGWRGNGESFDTICVYASFREWLTDALAASRN